MKPKKTWHRRAKSMLVVAPASARTWVVAHSRRLIPGALFHTREAAVRYAVVLAEAAGLRPTQVKVLAAA